MLTLVTGQPGNGKTLHTIVGVEARRVKEGRAVYQNGIGGLSLPWLLLDSPDKWESCPDGSIIVIDEAWRSDPRAFGLRGTTKAPPSYVENLATHRHRGFDIYLVTQSASQIDPFVRALVGKHIHLDRKFGMETSTVWEWERCADPKSNSEKREAQSSRWSFPKEAFGWYSSSVEHTHKLSLPWKKIGVLILGIGMLVMGASCAYHSLNKNKIDKSKPVVGQSSQTPGVTGSLGSLTPNDYWGMGRKERVVGLPESAPIYDTLQKPRSQPRVDGCMSLARGHAISCTCTAPGGAYLDLPLQQCLAYVKKGWFDETLQYNDAKEANKQFLNSEQKGVSDSSAPVSSAGTQSLATSGGR